MSKKNKKIEHSVSTLNPLLKIFIKISILTILVGGLVIYIDYNGYFNPNKSKDHTFKKWTSFYKLTDEKTEIDIMLFGNSHLYTGINPKNLSLSIGANSFVFAAPGTSISDSYFGLKEAIKKNKPKLVIIETYGINDFNNYEFKKGSLSDQFISFAARKDLYTKLVSTPYLFNVDNYFYAWSTTIRNHDYLFNNQKQLKKNIELIKNEGRRNKKEKLYLGRFVRFSTGLKNNILHMYDSLGAPVNGADYSYSKQAESYVNKIVELCKNKKIELMFLTLPMYDKHTENYAIWNDKLSEILDKHPHKWLNLQNKPAYNGFNKVSFEDTYNTNQHMTYKGSLLATNKLVNYIKDSINVKLPNRKEDEEWHNLFYGSEGYFENYSPKKGDKNNKILFANKKLGSITINECLFLKINNKKNNQVLVKLDKESAKKIDLEGYKLQLMVRFKLKEEVKMARINLVYDQFHQTENEIIFSSYVKPLSILEVASIKLVPIPAEKNK